MVYALRRTSGSRITTFVPLTFEKRGIKKVVIGPAGVEEPVVFDDEEPAVPLLQENALLKALGLAHYWERLIETGQVADVAEIAQREQMDITRVREFLRLVMLDPWIVQAVLEGRQVGRMTLERLVRSRIPVGWEEQRGMVMG